MNVIYLINIIYLIKIIIKQYLYITKNIIIHVIKLWSKIRRNNKLIKICLDII